MARQRRNTGKTTLTSLEVGSESPEATSVKLAVPGDYPEDYEDYPQGWKAAFDHAARAGNTVKASMNYADEHETQHEPEEVPEPTEPPNPDA